MNTRNDLEGTAWLFLIFLYLTVGLIVIPIRCLLTVVIDGPENTPAWLFWFTGIEAVVIFWLLIQTAHP